MLLFMYHNMHIHDVLEFDTRLDLKYSAEANWRSLAVLLFIMFCRRDTYTVGEKLQGLLDDGMMQEHSIFYLYL